MESSLCLYPHNLKALKKIITQLDSGESVTGILHATGTGKSNIALALAKHYRDKKVLFVTRYNSIIEHVSELKDIIEKEDKVKIDNIRFISYSSLVNMTREEIERLVIDILITDEFHHVGAPVWQDRIESIVKTHLEMKIVGMSAYSIRDRGTPYERDMAEAMGDELFSDKIVSYYTLVDAILDGVLPTLRYKTVLIVLEEFLNEIFRKGERKYDVNSKMYKDLIGKLEYLRGKLNLQDGLDTILRRNISIGDKIIYFCPVGGDSKELSIDTIMEEMWDKLISLGYKEEDIVFYKSTSKDGKMGKLNRDAFYNNVSLEGKMLVIS